MRPLFVMMIAVSAMLVLSILPAAAYTSVSSCLNCHSDWQSGNPSPHDMHQDFTNSCRDCHATSLSSALNTNSSANYANYGCNGCHLKAGLVTYHVNTEASSCGCHNDVLGTSPGEQLLPYYYQSGRSSIVNTCRVNAQNGGEDWDGDGFGLDNDGDLDFDAADSDCEGIVPVTREDWGTLKALFGGE